MSSLTDRPSVGPTDLAEAPSGPIDPARLWNLFSFVPGSRPLSVWVDVLRRLPLSFTPTRVRVRVPGEDVPDIGFDDDTWHRSSTLEGATSVRLEQVENAGRDDERVVAVLQVTVARVVHEVLLSHVEANPELLAALLEAPGLIGGSRGDEQDATWQGETQPQHFEFWYPHDWQHLPRTTDRHGREIIDVSGHPGRISNVVGWRMWAAQDDWYGPGARLYVDLDALATLPLGEVTDLGEDRWHVRLWPDGASFEQIRTAQATLREHLGYDAAAARDDEIYDLITADQPDDPMFVAQDGTFDHGGTTRILQYFSAQKRPTFRSRAAWLEILEFDAEHHQVHSEVIDLRTQPHPEI
ncbi:hypothetical protein D9V37_19070 [Nocardioides mangrovicus]|uniref:Uncharacterized protein n=1 Tax=Nocardioides mangrovicus TaxID=2478913 RepID=A0A3L8NZ48_9ACTN|nr:hypothetical protein [Nocardioides mangrovicus]RLV48174.1 hypothetical protein D9V37_19070 [Nocardioides mangrovicus]